MTLGHVIYEEYTKNIVIDTYSLFYEEFKKTTHQEHIESIIRCIDETYKILFYYEPSPNDKNMIDSIQIGDKKTTYQSYETCKLLADSYKEKHLNNLFTITLYFRYNTICNYLNIHNEYEYKLHHYVTFFNKDETIQQDVSFHYGMLLLSKQQYKESFPYILYLNPVYVKHLNIEPKTMCFFKKDDRDKSLLIYMSGGIGDNIMYSRFIRKICETYATNKILFLVYDNLYWIYSHIYKDIKQLSIIPYYHRDSIPPFDYHINVSQLFNALELEYKDIYIEYFPHLPSYPIDFCIEKKSIIINWKGCSKNTHEKYNRSIDLELLIPLFKLEHIQWISITQDITHEEKCILNTYNVAHVSLDQEESFRHSTTLLKKVNCVITTDTSLAHMCGTLGIVCYVLLTSGCDWRWTHNNTTNWYPNMKLLRQETPFDWSHVIHELKNVANHIV